MSNIIRTNVNYAFNQPLNLENPQPIVAKRDPGTADKAPIGQEWVNVSTNNVFFLTSIANNLANWVGLAGGAGSFSSLTVNPGPTNLSTVGNGAVNIGNATNTGAVTITAGTGNVSIVGGGHTISVGNDAAANTVNVGSSNGAAVLALNAGSGGATLTAANGAITINSGTGALGVSTDAAATAVSLATGAGVKTTILGSTNTTSATTVQSGSGALNVTSTNGALTINSGTGALGISTDAAATTVSIATGAAVKALTIGSNNGVSSTTIQAGTVGGLTLSPTAGNISMIPNTSTPVASPTATVVANIRLGYAAFTGFTTAAAASQVFTVTNSFVSAASAIFVTVNNLGTNNALMTLTGVVPGAGTFNVATTNNGTQALNGNVNILWWVID